MHSHHLNFKSYKKCLSPTQSFSHPVSQLQSPQMVVASWLPFNSQSMDILYMHVIYIFLFFFFLHFLFCTLLLIFLGLFSHSLRVRVTSCFFPVMAALYLIKTTMTITVLINSCNHCTIGGFLGDFQSYYRKGYVVYPQLLWITK